MQDGPPPPSAKRSSFERIEHAYASLSKAERAAAADDPDHLIYAAARVRFCTDFRRAYRGREAPPDACTESKGPLVGAASAAAQRERAEALLDDWKVRAGRGAPPALVVSGGAVPVGHSRRPKSLT